MKVNGHGIRDHVRLLAPLLGLVAIVWMLRLMLSACGSPVWCLRVVSVTEATAGSVVLAALLIHFKRFGGYSNVVVASLILNVWAQLLIVGAIGFAVLTGIQNVYTAPQFSLPWLNESDPAHLRHIYGQLTFGVGLGTLSGAAVGCLMLWLLRLLLPQVGKSEQEGLGVSQKLK